VSRSASRCNAGTFSFREDSCVFPTPSQPAQRAAGRSRGGFEPERRRVPGKVYPGTAHGGIARYRHPVQGCALRRFGASASAPPSLQRQTRRRSPPTCSIRADTRDAPDYVADRTTGKTRDDAERSLHFALGSAGNRFGAAPTIAFRPSPHPRIRWTVASVVHAVSAHGHTRPPPPRVAKCRTKC
jgi:hypothetical protein